MPLPVENLPTVFLVSATSAMMCKQCNSATSALVHQCAIVQWCASAEQQVCCVCNLQNTKVCNSGVQQPAHPHCALHNTPVQQSLAIGLCNIPVLQRPMTMSCARNTTPAATSAWELGHLGTYKGGGANIFYFFCDQTDTSTYLVIFINFFKHISNPTERFQI